MLYGCFSAPEYSIDLTDPQFEFPDRLLPVFQDVYFYYIPFKMFKKLGLFKEQSLTLLRLLKTLDYKKQLYTSQFPKLILCGTRDYAGKPGAERLYKVSTNSRLLFIENRKHELNRGKPEMIAQAM